MTVAVNPVFNTFESVAAHETPPTMLGEDFTSNPVVSLSEFVFEPETDMEMPPR